MHYIAVTITPLSAERLLGMACSSHDVMQWLPAIVDCVRMMAVCLLFVDHAVAEQDPYRMDGLFWTFTTVWLCALFVSRKFRHDRLFADPKLKVLAPACFVVCAVVFCVFLLMSLILGTLFCFRGIACFLVIAAETAGWGWRVFYLARMHWGTATTRVVTAV